MLLKSISNMEPMLITALKPTFWDTLQSKTEVIMAPLWLMKATLPFWGIRLAKEAFSPDVGQMMPKQLGPTIRRLPLVAMRCTSSSNFSPSGPTSLKPAEMMMAFLTPWSTQSWITPGTVAAGVTTMTRSTWPGQAAMDRKARMPRTCSRLGFTG